MTFQEETIDSIVAFEYQFEPFFTDTYEYNLTPNGRPNEIDNLIQAVAFFKYIVEDINIPYSCKNSISDNIDTYLEVIPEEKKSEFITDDTSDQKFSYHMVVDGREYLDKLQSMMNHPSFKMKDDPKTVTVELFEGDSLDDAVLVDTIKVPFALYDDFFIDK